MILPDVNVLIGAFRPDHSHHPVCRPWLNRVIEDTACFGICPASLSALIRVTTNLRYAGKPSSLTEAFGFCQDLFGQPHCQVVEPGQRHWEIFQRLCVETETRGALVTDAWYAALAIEWGCEFVTFDRDYARFPGLKWHVPAVA